MTFPSTVPEPSPGYAVFSWFTLPAVPSVTSERVGVGVTIIATLLGAVIVRWMLHRTIDRVVDNAMTRAARHESQTPRRASRILANATGLDQTRRTQRAGTMGAILKSTSKLLEEPVVAGVESIAGSVVTVRVFAKCAPNENFAVQREIRERVKAAFDVAGIRAPQVMRPYGGEPGGPPPGT